MIGASGERRSVPIVDDEAELALLRAIASGQDGRSSQDEVAARLDVSQDEAARRLRAAGVEGLVEEAVDESAGAGGRRVYWVNLGRGLEEFDRLEAAERSSELGVEREQ